MNVSRWPSVQSASAMLAVRIAKAELRARKARLAVIRKNLYVAIKALDEEIRAA